MTEAEKRKCKKAERDRQENEKELNSLAQRWTSIDSNEDAAVKAALREKIFLKAFHLFQLDRECKSKMAEDEAYIDIIVLGEVLEKYKPEHGEFTHYYNFIRSRRKKDLYSDPVAGAISLDVAIDDEEKVSKLDQLGIKRDGKEYYSELLDEKMSGLVAMILNFSQRHTGRENNEARREWYRIFFTEDITYSLKEFPVEIHFEHERDIFEAMNCEYLDYYMSMPCRRQETLVRTALKRYCELVEGGADKETPLPIPADVSLYYYARCKKKKATRSNRSNYYKSYKEERENLET